MIRKDHALVFAVTLAVVGGYFVVLNPGEAQQQPDPPPPNLFTPLDLPDWVDPALPDDTSILRSRPVSVNFDVLTAAQPAEPGADPPTVPMTFNLFDDVTVTVIFHRAKPRYDIEIPENPMDLLGQEFEPVGYTWTGTIVGEQQGQAIVVSGPSMCITDIHVTGGGSYHVRSVSAGQHVVREIDASGPRECNVEIDQEAAAQGGEPEGGGGDCDVDRNGCETGNAFDVIVVYSPAAREAAENQRRDIEAEIDAAVADANEAYENSQIQTRMRLVYKGEMYYPDSFPGNPSATQFLRNQWDGYLDGVHPLRSALRADLVCLFMDYGQGFSSASIFQQESPYEEARAFSSVWWDRAVSPFHDFAHETGHNLGCAHHRADHCPCDEPGVSCSECPEDCVDNCECWDGACKHSYGYNFPPPDPTLYRTIMAGGFGDMIPHFSNPDVYYPFFPFYPTGVAPPSCNSADNALSINGTSDTIANYRTTCDTTDTTWMASHDFFAGQGTDGGSRSLSISDNGQYMAFTSDATDFGGQNGVSDILLYNRESTMVSLISRHAGSETAGDSYSPVVSGNGRYVTFVSDAGDIDALGPDDTNDLADIYIWRQSPPIPENIWRVSLNSDENQTEGGGSFSPSITHHGRLVAFASDATNLIADDGNGNRDIFLRDRFWGTTKRISLSTEPLDLDPDGASYAPSISARFGRYIAFESDATNLVSDDTLAHRDIFVHDHLGQSTARVSLTNFGLEANGPSYSPAISSLGTFVVFESDASNLVPDDTNNSRDIFLRNVAAQTTSRLSVTPDPQNPSPNGPSYAPAVSADEEFVVFHSDATNLVAGDTNGVTDVFLYEIDTATITRVSINSAGEQATGGGSAGPAISKDGRFIAFESDATNLVGVFCPGGGDCNGVRDVFFRDRGVMLPGDFDGDYDVDETDLAILLAIWGPYVPCPSHMGPDLDYDCAIGAGDLAILLGNWTG